MSASDFGQRLARERDAAGLSQSALARATGLSQSAISQIESGARDPSLRTARRLAAALGATFASLVTEEAAKSPPAAVPFFRQYTRLTNEQRRELREFAAYLAAKRAGRPPQMIGAEFDSTPAATAEPPAEALGATCPDPYCAHPWAAHTSQDGCLATEGDRDCGCPAKPPAEHAGKWEVESLRDEIERRRAETEELQRAVGCVLYPERLGNLYPGVATAVTEIAGIGASLRLAEANLRQLRDENAAICTERDAMRADRDRLADALERIEMTAAASRAGVVRQASTPEPATQTGAT